MDQNQYSVAESEQVSIYDDPPRDIAFYAEGEEVLRLDKEGFHFKGETITDAGEAYELFTQFMRRAFGGA